MRGSDVVVAVARGPPPLSLSLSPSLPVLIEESILARGAAVSGTREHPPEQVAVIFSPPPKPKTLSARGPRWRRGVRLPLETLLLHIPAPGRRRRLPLLPRLH